MKKGYFCFIVIIIMTLSFTISAFAKPPGLRDSCLGKKIDNFNVILKPNQWDENGNGCNGSRIFFFDDGSNNFGQIYWDLDPSAHGYRITDCDGTDGYAEVTVDEDAQHFVIAIRLVGPNTSHLQLTCTEVGNDLFTGNENLCIVDGVRNIYKGNDFTKISGNIAEPELEGITYDLDGDWKIFQVWLIEWDGTNCLND